MVQTDSRFLVQLVEQQARFE